MSNKTASSAARLEDEQTPSTDKNSEGEHDEGYEEVSPSNAVAEGAEPSPVVASDLTRSEGENSVAPLSAASEAAAPRLAPIESMEVRVDFEVGRVTLPVSKLANVAAGSVIDMPGVSLDSVVAKSGGHAFAFGEFVELGGRVGFRILKLAETKEKH